MIPNRLFKYRAFDSFALKLICDSEAWYSRTPAFNDPIEELTETINDVDRMTLEALHRRLFPEDSLQRLQRNQWTYDGDYNDVEASIEEYVDAAKREIDDKVREILGSRGVLTLSARWDSPLMWSHYADSHRGFCIEYDATNHRCQHIGQVDYTSSRGIRLSDIAAWKLKGDENALRSVVESAYFRKSPDWAYESEWRDVSRGFGAGEAPFQLSGITFGMRCPRHVRTALMLVFSGYKVKPDFYEARFKPGSFEMSRSLVDPNEIAHIRPSGAMIFGIPGRCELPFDITD
ncbi:DUF2971 domain-containing protein [Xanthomonas axonopodis pv. begoniae]|nr:DUF2971 domain-containing protein [Xanthomonas axonopodis pv. begoniae]MBO9774080.1 DUF2971 domain-containing protein [Xanthomonas axonopodis pv. begoniae]PPT36087.1 hypothetical protein XabCFBP2524_10760 [Xanthomonas axonopodis pv. begoniae]